jgi:hypothetical protein
MPTAVRRDDRVSLLRPPGVAFVQANAVMVLEDRIDHNPRGLNRIFSREERAVAGHGVAEKPLVGRFVSRPLFRQVEFSLLSNEILACDLHARGKSNGWIG